MSNMVQMKQRSRQSPKFCKQLNHSMSVNLKSSEGIIGKHKPRVTGKIGKPMLGMSMKDIHKKQSLGHAQPKLHHLKPPLKSPEERAKLKKKRGINSISESFYSQTTVLEYTPSKRTQRMKFSEEKRSMIEVIDSNMTTHLETQPNACPIAITQRLDPERKVLKPSIKQKLRPVKRKSLNPSGFLTKEANDVLNR